MKYQD